MFNDFLKEFKDSLASKGKQDFWDEVISGKMFYIILYAY